MASKADILLADMDPALIRTARTNHYHDLGYVPKPGQAALDSAVDAGKRTLGFFTPPQDGKSFHVAKHVGAYWVFPKTKIWIVAPTYEDGSKEFLYIWDDWAHLGLTYTATTKHKDVRGGNMRIELKNGTWVQVITAQDRENLRREQLDVVVYAEASKLPANLHKQYVYARVERRRGKVFYPTTHKGYGWVYTDVMVPSLPMKDKTFTWGPWVDGHRERLGGEPNPHYDPDAWSCQVSYTPEFGDTLHAGEYTDDQIAKARRTLSPQMFGEQFGGEACSYAGLVLPFDPAVHECDPFPIPRDWRTVVGWDHGAGGGSDPTAILVASVSPTGHWYWWGEIYDERQRSVKERGGLLKVLLDGRTLSCPVMRGRDAKQVGWELAEIGIASTYPDASAIDARIIKTTALMREGQWSLLRGRCPHLRDQVTSWEWNERDIGKPIDGNDHAIEAAGMAALAPLAGVEETRADPDTLPGESRAVTEHWRPMREMLRKQEEAREAAKMTALLEAHDWDEDPMLESAQFIG